MKQKKIKITGKTLFVFRASAGSNNANQPTTITDPTITTTTATTGTGMR